MLFDVFVVITAYESQKKWNITSLYVLSFFSSIFYSIDMYSWVYMRKNYNTEEGPYKSFKWSQWREKCAIEKLSLEYEKTHITM
jgi:hypothetical protein